tara:strand:- start:26 stop:559 length:534 start_codon:yes stop_codon:yes gene_type:complete
MADGTLKVGTITNSAGSGNITIGSGVTLLSNVPAFEVWLSANQGISDNTATKVQFDEEVFDTDNCYDNSTNYRFTPTVAGKYHVYSRVQMDSQAGSNFQQGFLKIYKNGSAYSSLQMNMNANAPENISLNTFSTVDMNGSSDYLEMFGTIDDTSGTPTFRGSSGLAWTVFGAYRIGA